MVKMLSELILDLGKCPNHKMLKVKVHVVQFGRLPKSDISYKSISDKVLYNHCSKKKLKRFGKYIKKNGFPFVFSKSDFDRGKSFSSKKVSEKANQLRMCPCIGVNVGET